MYFTKQTNNELLVVLYMEVDIMNDQNALVRESATSNNDETGINTLSQLKVTVGGEQIRSKSESENYQNI